LSVLRRAVPSPACSNRLEVIVPSRVLPEREIVSCLGYSHPGLTLTFAGRLVFPVFRSLPLSKDATPWTFLSWGSILLHGLYPKPLSCASQPRTTLMGFLAPSTHTGKDSPRSSCLTRKPSTLIRKPKWRWPVGPTPLATVPLTGFLNLSATCSSLCRPVIFRQVTFVGFALQGFIPFTKPPATHRRRITLLSFLPPVAQPQDLGQSSFGRAIRLLGGS
jgi:hypothetical protein